MGWSRDVIGQLIIREGLVHGCVSCEVLNYFFVIVVENGLRVSVRKVFE